VLCTYCIFGEQPAVRHAGEGGPVALQVLALGHLESIHRTHRRLHLHNQSGVAQRGADSLPGAKELRCTFSRAYQAYQAAGR